MKKVSVVVPCFNMAQYLDRCMEHLLNQTIGIENLEIILVDDASDDGGASLNKMLEYEAEYPASIIVIPLQENLRQGGARNVGISYAGGEYVMFCDADDWLVLEATEKLYETAKGHDADVVQFEMANYPNVTQKLAGENENYLLQIENDEQRKKLLLEIPLTYSLGGMSKFYRLELLKEHNIRFAEHAIFEEPSFTLPLRFYQKNHCYIGNICYIAYPTPNSTTRGDFSAGGHKWDNLKVWCGIVEDMRERKLLEPYHDELEYLFFKWTYRLTIRMLYQRNCALSADDFKMLTGTVIKYFPQVESNPFLSGGGYNDQIDRLLFSVLNMEFTEESAKVANEVLKKYLL